MKRWLLAMLAAISWSASAEQVLLRQLCETVASEQELTVTMGSPVVVAHHRNGLLMTGKETQAINLTPFLPLLTGDNRLSETCLAYLQQQKVIRTEPGDKGDPVLARVYFQFDRSRLSPTSVRILDNIARQLRDNPNMVELEGHTDSTGSEQYNLALGLRRSREVEQYLAGIGMKPERMKATTKGEAEPLADNATAKGREQNRRVDINVL